MLSLKSSSYFSSDKIDRLDRAVDMLDTLDSLRFS